MPCFARTSRDIVQVAELHLAVRHGVGLAVDDALVEAGAVDGSDLVAEGVALWKGQKAILQLKSHYLLFSLFFGHFWPNRLESGVEVEGVSVGLGRFYVRLLGQVEEALAGDSAPCGLQVVIVFSFCSTPRIVARVGSAQVEEDDASLLRPHAFPLSDRSSQPAENSVLSPCRLFCDSHNFSLSTAVGLSERQYSVFRGFFRRFMQK